jgi:hypothetical protein
MSSLEKGKFSEVGEHDFVTGQRRKEKQIELFVNGDGELRKRLDSVDVDSTTPLEALHILHELKTLAGEQDKPS